jgi:hypothetical protein
MLYIRELTNPAHVQGEGIMEGMKVGSRVSSEKLSTVKMIKQM